MNSYGSGEAAPAAAPAAKKPADDDDVDLFGSESEDEDSKRVKAERLAAYAAKKEKSNSFSLKF